MEEFENLAEALECRAKGSKGIFFIGEKEDKFISYSELYDKAFKALKKLQQKGLKKGSELIIQIDDNQNYLVTFWACILGGIIPIPIAPGNTNENKEKLIKMISALINPSLIANIKALNSFKKYIIENELINLNDFINNRTITDEEIINIDDGAGSIEILNKNDIAFIQFTSGTTGDSKGVVLTHKNLLANTKAIILGTNGNENDSSLSWMPLYHDMGFIGFHLTPLMANTNQYFMQTTLFIRRPLLWLRKASEYKIKVLACPNFGYEYFLGFFKPQAANEWDLSNVRIIFNGAEYISSDICNSFLKEMSPYGLKDNVMFAVYGGAEASLAVTFPPAGEGLKKVFLDRDFLNIGDRAVEVDQDNVRGIAFVDEGYPVNECEVTIRDLDNNVLNEGYLGLINIKGINVTSSYYNNEEETKRNLTETGWLNMQDIGVILGGRLIFVGRYKELINKEGKAYYPHDIETAAEQVKGIETGRIAAAGVDCNTKGEQDIVIFVYYKKKLEDFLPLAEEIIKIIEEKLKLKIKEVIPVREMPKTTSGKIQRFKLIEKYYDRQQDNNINN